MVATSPTAHRHAGLASRLWSAICAQPSSLIGTVVVLLAALAAVSAPYLPIASPDAFSTRQYMPPSLVHPMGTDNLGRDILARTIWGARLGMGVAIVSAGISTGLGVLLGSIPAYYGGVIDDLFSRVFDIFLLIPAFFLMILIVALFGTNVWFIMIVIGITTWPRSARIMRSQVLSLKPRAFVQAARAAGGSHVQVLFRHIIPNGLPPVITNGTLLMGTAILTEAGLSFLGMGDPNVISWGRMIFEGQRQLRLAPWLSIFPGLAMLVVVWGLNMVGDAVNRLLSPQVREDRRILRADYGFDRERRRRDNPEIRASAQTQSLLEVHNLRMYYRLGNAVVRAVDGVSFDVRNGEMYGLVGESGCGKTSLGFALLRILPFNAEIRSGAIIFKGQELLSLTEEQFRRVRWEQISMIFQSAMNALNPVLRVGDQLVRAYRLHRPQATRSEARERVEELFEMVGITPHHFTSYPHELSGGMRQRVVIALSLLLNPSLIIADEPVTALDVLVQDQILDELERLRSRLGISMILITHDMGVIAETCDRVGVLYAGQIVEEAPTTVIFNESRHPYTRALMLALPTLEGPRRRLASLAGRPFDLRREPRGCRFADRCPLVQDICRWEEPPLVRINSVHVSRCHFALDERVMRVGEVIAVS